VAKLVSSGTISLQSRVACKTVGVWCSWRHCTDSGT